MGIRSSRSTRERKDAADDNTHRDRERHRNRIDFAEVIAEDEAFIEKLREMKLGKRRQPTDGKLPKALKFHAKSTAGTYYEHYKNIFTDE